MTVVPSYPDLADGRRLSAHRKTYIPAVHIQQVGAGRVVYFPWDIDRTFWEVLSTDHLKLLRNAVTWATNEEPPVSVTGPGVLDVTIWKQKDSLTVHLVNLTNPMMMKGPVREVIPLVGQKFRLQLPAGMQAKAVHMLVSGADTPNRIQNGVLEMGLPPIGLHEVIAVDLVRA